MAFYTENKCTKISYFVLTTSDDDRIIAETSSGDEYIFW